MYRRVSQFILKFMLTETNSIVQLLLFFWLNTLICFVFIDIYKYILRVKQSEIGDF